MNFREHYRKNLSLTALIFIDRTEYKVRIQNLSTSGVLICIDASSSLYEQPDMFKFIQYAASIDIYIENLELVNKAEIIHVDFDGDNLMVGMKFKQREKSYKRKSYRKNLAAPGCITLYEQADECMAINISENGMMIRLLDYVLMKQGMMAKFKFTKLNLSGDARVVWIKYDKNNGILSGLQYQH